MHDPLASLDLSRACLVEAVRLLRAGDLVAFPTETVYGLGADAASADAVARIFAAKGRPKFNPLIAHVADPGRATREGVFMPAAEHLAERFWPGPLTLVLRRRPDGTVCDLACAGLDSVGLRVPAHPVALDLLRAYGRPVAAPSANRSGRLSPTSAADVKTEIGEAVALVLEGGRCPIGVESTIVACLGDTVAVLRPGAITVPEVEETVGRRLDSPSDHIRAPGMLRSHYAPRAKLRLDASRVEPGEAGLDFGSQFGLGAHLDLSTDSRLQEAAANLYRHLRALDGVRAHTIAVAPIPDHGLGQAINDRLRRAAAPRTKPT